MMKKTAVLICLLPLVSSRFSLADDLNLPVSTNTNDNVFVKIHGLQGFSGVNLVTAGESTTRLSLEMTNEFHKKTTENEQVILDYEQTTLTIDFAYGLNEQYVLGIEIPYLINSDGVLDSLIDNWHDLFDLPQGGRDGASRGEFLISFAGANQPVLVDETGQGIGDISVYSDRLFIDSSAGKVKARAKLKIPTGDEDQLFGSGGYGLSIQLNAAARLSDKIISYGGAGLNYLTQGDVLSSQQNDVIAAATVGLGWQINSRTMLSSQLDLNSKIYSETGLDAVSGHGGVLYLSVQHQLTKHTRLQFGITEDVINKDAVPDFGLKLSYIF